MPTNFSDPVSGKATSIIEGSGNDLCVKPAPKKKLKKKM
jgi:hypothetical protein